jgi:hypothetical protein
MSKHRPRRQTSGHPAKRAAARRPPARQASGPDGFAAKIAREAEGLTSAFEAELWASGLLGVFWEKRHTLPPAHWDPVDAALALGSPLVDALARIAGAGALTALAAIASVDDGDLGVRAGELAETVDLCGQAELEWLNELGKAAIVRGAAMREDVFDDGFNVYLEASDSSGRSQAVGVYIDNNLGVTAKDILLADNIDRIESVMRANPDPDGAVLRMEPLEPGVAAGHVLAAIEATDMILDAPVSDDFAPLRALALLRVAQASWLQTATDLPEVTQRERDGLRSEFLESAEGKGFAPDGDEAFVASLAIDFCSDYVDARPLRWSPAVVELFMADWLPRKVVAEPGLFESVPSALDAWVRFAGRKAGTPEWAINRTREEIPRWKDELLESSHKESPSVEFIKAARDAGIDFEDRHALEAFVSGWNARSRKG